MGKITEQRAERLLRWLRPYAYVSREAEELIRSFDWRTLDAIRHMVQYIRRRFPKVGIVLCVDDSVFDDPHCVIRVFTSPILYDIDKVWEAVYEHFVYRYVHTKVFLNIRVVVDEVRQ